MKQNPKLEEMVLFVRVLREDYPEFQTLVKSNNPPEWLPTDYRVTHVNDSNQLDENQGEMIVRITLQYLGQTGT